MRTKHWSVARQLLVLQSLLLVVVLAAGAVSLFVYTRGRDESAARTKVLDIAQTISDDPFVTAAAVGADPSRVLQPYAERIRIRTHVDFVVIMAPDRTRFTHPTPRLIGRKFIGDIAPALRGRAFTETFTGTLGQSVRAVAPVRDAAGGVVALVAVGVTTRAIRADLIRQLPYLATGLTLLLVVALVGGLLVSRRMRRQTRGLDSESIGRMYDSHDAVLHSVREGLIVIGADGRIGVINDEARRLLGVSGELVGTPVAQLDVPESVRTTLCSGEGATDESHLTGERVVVLNQSRTEWDGRRYGTVTTLRDRTELEALTGELDAAKAFTEALRSQAHEAANRLHTMVVLVETGRSDDAVAYATEELELAQRLTDQVLDAVGEPVLIALLLGKSAQASERGVELIVTEDSRLPAGLLPGSDLVTVVGNLIDNAIDAAVDSDSSKRVTVTVRADERDVLIRVEDTGTGLPPDLVDAAFTRGWSTKVAATSNGRGLGLALVNQVVTRHRGRVEVAVPVDGGTCFTVYLPAHDLVGAG